jgi:signal transduction histidine kinase/DNA-binding NarL/FixJ family response regulator
LETWFDEPFLSGAARDFRQTRLRMAVTVGAGLLLAIGADWRLALAWTAVVLAFEAPLQKLMQPISEGAKPPPFQAWAIVILRLILTYVWTFPGVIFSRSGGAAGQTYAMSFSAALLLYLVTRRDRSPVLIVTATPALAAPLVTALLFPAPFLAQVVSLLFAGAMAGLAGASLLRDVREAGPDLSRTVRPATPRSYAPVRPVEGRDQTSDDETLSLEALREAKVQAEAASEAKSAFLATMSHEIRTPLNGVLGMTQSLAADPLLTQQQRAKLDMVRKSGESLLAILNDVLDLSKIEAGKLEVESIEFDLEDVARGAHASFKTMAVEKGLEFKLIIDPAARGVYLGDPTRLRQVLYNLISNALKFTERGEVRVSIGQAGREGLRLSVADTGIGMDPAQLERIFDKFEQADASSTRRYGGTGLGLAICRDLCGLMGGSIAAESEPGRGTRFSVTLPLPKVADRSLAPAPPGLDSAPLDTDASAMRVLAAEDNPANQLVLKALLAQFGIEPVVVENGALAIDAWADGNFDIILMDVQMPEMDGMEATRAIRCEEARTGRARTPIIALTANAMSHQVAEYAEVGMDAHAPKPVDVRKLFAMMKGLVSQTPPAAEPANVRRTRQEPDGARQAPSRRVG